MGKQETTHVFLRMSFQETYPFEYLPKQVALIFDLQGLYFKVLNIAVPGTETA